MLAEQYPVTQLSPRPKQDDWVVLQRSGVSAQALMEQENRVRVPPVPGLNGSARVCQGQELAPAPPPAQNPHPDHYKWWEQRVVDGGSSKDSKDGTSSSRGSGASTERELRWQQRRQARRRRGLTTADSWVSDESSMSMVSETSDCYPALPKTGSSRRLISCYFCAMDMLFLMLTLTRHVRLVQGCPQPRESDGARVGEPKKACRAEKVHQ